MKLLFAALVALASFVGAQSQCPPSQDGRPRVMVCITASPPNLPELENLNLDGLIETNQNLCVDGALAAKLNAVGAAAYGECV